MFVFALIATLETSQTFLNEIGGLWLVCGFILLTLAWLIGSWLDANFALPRRRAAPPPGQPPTA
jgi:hypothetical protein